MVAFFKKYLRLLLERKTLKDIIFIYSGIRKYYNEIIFNTKTHFYPEKKLFASFYNENDFAKYFAKCRHLFI